MATNIIYDRIFKGLKLILGRSAVVEGDRMPHSAEYVRLSLSSNPEMVENTGASYAMAYFVNIDLVTNKANKPKYMTQAIADIMNDLNSHTAYTADSVYYWHTSEILSSEPDGALDENDKQLYAARILWTCTHTEIKE